MSTASISTPMTTISTHSQAALSRVLGARVVPGMASSPSSGTIASAVVVAAVSPSDSVAAAGGGGGGVLAEALNMAAGVTGTGTGAAAGSAGAGGASPSGRIGLVVG